MALDGKTVIDLSKFNTVSNYSALAAGCDGIILRMGYRSFGTGTITEDPVFKTHFNNLKGKVPIGVYFFTTAITELEAKEEANWVIDKIKSMGIELAFPIAVDTEIADVKKKSGRSDNLDKATRTKNVVAFCEECIARGYMPMIYAADSWFTSQLEYGSVAKYLKWVARYSDKEPNVKDNVVGWQKTDGFKVAGINKGVDMSVWYADITSAKKPATTTKPTQTEAAPSGQIVLKNAKLYSSSGSSTAVKTVSGTYYIWDSKVMNNKIRVTTKPEYVGVAGKITGWIDKV